MATNTNTMQINTFAKGMDTDTSDMLIDNESYRLAKNLRYITDIDETTGELRLIEGAKQLNVSYNGIDNLRGLKIVAFNSIRNIGALICINNAKHWAVFRIESGDGAPNDLSVTKVFGLCEEQLGQDTKISTTLKWEDDSRLQLYIADGKHPLMKINLFDETGSTEINYVLSHTSQNLNQPVIDSILSGGQLKAGLVQYAYQLYNDNNVSTNVSPLSHIKEIVAQYREIGSIGLQFDQTSSMGLKLKISVDSGVYDLYKRIRIYRIQYLVNGQLPQIQLIYDGKYTTESGYFLFDDLGQSSLQELTVEEFNSLVGVVIIPKVIEQKNNILFAGNISYDLDTLDEEYLNMDFRAFSSGDLHTGETWPVNISADDNRVNENLNLANDYDFNYWLKPGSSISGEIGGTGQNIEWRLYDEAENIVLNSLPDTQHPGEQALKIKNDSSRYNRSQRKSLAHDEIYRYGIILYSKNGTKYPVKWIADIRTPNIGTLASYNEISYWSNNVEYSKILYPAFKLLATLDSDKISGYEIVRAKRTINDCATISQGIVASVVQPVGSNKELCSSGMPFLDHVKYGTQRDSGIYVYADSQSNVLQFYSPETSYAQDQIIQLLDQNDNFYLQALYPVTPFIDQNAQYGSTETIGNYQYTTNTQAYTDSKMSYHQLVRLTSEQRYKYYNADLVKNHFSPEDPNISDSDLFNTVTGYNLYKLGRINMPTVVWDYTNEVDITPVYKFAIQDYSRVRSTDWDKLITSTQSNVKDTMSVVDGYTFYNCVAPFIISDTNGQFTVNSMNKTAPANMFKNELVGTCDPSLIFSFDKNDIEADSSIVRFYYREKFKYRGDRMPAENVKGMHEYSLLCNLRHNITPYGGFSKSSRDNTIYIQQGYYYPVSYTNQIAMYDGDVSISTYEFVPTHKWDGGTSGSPKCSIICQVAVESRIDTFLDSGDRFSNTNTTKSSLVQVNPCNFNDEYIQEKPSYVYNTAYSIQPDVLLSAGSGETDRNIDSFDYRVHYSNQAEANQYIDPWLVFQPLNYLDVDSKYGAITNMRLFKNQLVFWQEKATGVLSVNERVQMVDQSNLPLILGTGGVLDRYDYFTTTNGMKQNQHADAQSEQALYWWDYDNHSICAYSGGVVQLSKVKKIQNLLNSWHKQDSLISSDLQNQQWPLLTYDNKYNEVLFKIGSEDGEMSTTIVYNEQQAQFTSLYNIDPTSYFNIGSNLILTDNDTQTINLYKWNQVVYDQYENPTSVGFYSNRLLPYLKYVINDNKGYVKVYDNVEFAGTIPNSDAVPAINSTSASTLTDEIRFDFNTPLKQSSFIDGTKITNRQLDFKFAIPRSGQSEWGDRLRGKTMQCEMSSTSNSLNFSLQYIFTKYRISWS